MNWWRLVNWLQVALVVCYIVGSVFLLIVTAKVLGLI